MKTLKHAKKLKSFMLLCDPWNIGNENYNLQWRIIADGKEYSEVECVSLSHFESLADYVIKNSYRKLRNYLGLADGL